MKRTIYYKNGVAVEYAFVPESDLVLASSAYIAQIELLNGHKAQVYMPRNGLPVVLVESAKDAKGPFSLPPYEELERMCEEQSYSKYGQSYRIIDAMMRDDVCSFEKACGLRHTIEENLLSNTIMVFINDQIKTGFNR